MPRQPKHNPKALRSTTSISPWFILFLATLYYAYEFVQRVDMSIFSPFLIQDLKWDAASIGVIGAAYYYAYSLMQIPAGILIDWLGSRRLATLGMVLMTLGSFGFSFVDSQSAAFFARILIGIGSSFAFICCMRLIIIWFPPFRFALLAGFTNLIGYLGATMGQVPLTYLLHRQGWRHSMITLSAIGVVLTILIFMFIREKPFLKQKHRRSQQPPKRKAPSIFKGVKAVMQNRLNWMNGLYGGLSVGPTSAFAALFGLQFLVQADHLSQIAAAQALSLVFIGVAAGSPIFGWLSMHYKKQQIFLVVASALSIVITSLLFYNNSIPIILIYSLCFVFGLLQSVHVLNFAISKFINPVKHSGVAIGFTNSMIMLGGAILQPLIGLILEWLRHGATLHHLPFYSTAVYQSGLVIIPICQSIALIIAIVFLKDRLTMKAAAAS